MNFMEKIKDWVLPRISPHYPAYPPLVHEVRQSFREWQQAETAFNFAPPGFIDYAVYRLNATERHYAALLTLAKDQGIKAWPDDLIEPVKNRESGVGNWEPGMKPQETTVNQESAIQKRFFSGLGS